MCELKLKYNKNISNFRVTFNGPIVKLISQRCLKRTKCYAIHDYYPWSGIENNVDKNIQDVRNLIYRFKDGVENDVNIVAELVSLSVKASDISLDNSCLMVVPASSPEKSMKRFHRFCGLVAVKLEIRNGYDYISVVKHEETKGTICKNILPYLSFDNRKYAKKNILLFDDVYTTGKSFQQVAQHLLNSGALSVTGIFLAKTTRE